MHRPLLALLLIPAALAAATLSQPDKPALDSKPAAEKKPAWPSFESPSQEMKDLAWLAGDWSVTTTYIGPDGTPYPSKTEATIQPILGGSFLQEQILIPGFKLSMTGLRSYDRFRKVYRFIWLDNIMSLADVFEGTLDKTDLTVSNLKAGTSSIMPGSPETFLRFTQRPGPDHDHFSLIWEASTDSGKTWKKTAEYAYLRKQK
jgi:hypothetical protein